MGKNEKDDFYDQYLWKEISIDPVELEGIVADENFLLTQIEVVFVREAKLVTRTLLLSKIIDIANLCLTEHQLLVFNLRMAGKTYDEIATRLGVNYTAIPNAINGIKSKKHSGRHHGGIYKKLLKNCKKDDRCIYLLDKLYELNKDDPDFALDTLVELDKEDTDKQWVQYRQDRAAKAVKK